MNEIFEPVKNGLKIEESIKIARLLQKSGVNCIEVSCGGVGEGGLNTVLMYTMAKCSGDISKEEKLCILSIFKEIFKLSDKEATKLLSNCSFYLNFAHVPIDA